MIKRLRLHITGRVQGVGFRPYIYNLAQNYQLGGFVFNTPFGVILEIEGEERNIKDFLRKIEKEKPPASLIENVKRENIVPKGEKTFIIKESRGGEEKSVLICADLSVCEACLKELFDRKNRRYLYPFINCTNCGPRFTIIKDIPYDRTSTTMKKFKMCKKCKTEYDDPKNRRFHAQPNACFICGPYIDLVKKSFFLKNKKGSLKETEKILEKVAFLIKEGKILAIKGIGGYHLGCDAQNIEAVKILRKRKNRPTKPFALMVDNLKVVEKYCFLNKKEKEILLSMQRPILLLRIKKKQPWMDVVAPNQKYLGIMIVYTPLHYLIFHYFKKYKKELILVMTSANKKDFPLVKDEKELKQIKKFTDYFLIHNRPIHTRCDDSIVRVFKGKEVIIRKARGYIPCFMEFKAKKDILAVGAELKNTFSLTKNNYIISSPYLGDLKNYANYEFFINTLSYYKKIFDFKPQVVAYDLHPLYLSTQYALSLENIKKIGIQHHHAHLVSCMLENNLKEKVIGVCFDGVGFGLDKNIWGGEFFILDRKSFIRKGHFKYFGLIGYNKAIEEIGRISFYILYTLLEEKIFSLDLKFLKFFKKEKLKLFSTLIKKKMHSLTSSCGRLFDCASNLLGLKDKITYEAEAAIMLEMVALDFKGKKSAFDFEIKKEKNVYIIDWGPLFLGMLKEIRRKKDTSELAYKFHYTLACIIKEVCLRLKKDFGLRKVILSGGVFQNLLLLRETIKLLEKHFGVYVHQKIPTNDGGISAGQIVIANENI
jgi:hydrogenase maturation protein HypF